MVDTMNNFIYILILIALILGGILLGSWADAWQFYGHDKELDRFNHKLNSVEYTK